MRERVAKADQVAGVAASAQVLVVVGAGLAAEEHDRPTAYRLCERMRSADGRVAPLVCTDLWWLNDASLRERPTISIGGPEVNALTAYLADKLPSAYAIDGVLMVQFDVEFGDSIAACWGTDHSRSAAAVDVFGEKYLPGFLRALKY